MSDESRPRPGRSGRVLRTAGAAIVALLAVVIFILLVVLPELASVTETFADGVGLRTGAVIAFFITVALFVLLALVGGDGIAGELEVMIGAFFGFFTTLWLLIAWLF